MGIKKYLKKFKCKIFGHPLFANPASCPFTGKTYVYCTDCGTRKTQGQ